MLQGIGAWSVGLIFAVWCVVVESGVFGDRSGQS